MKVEVFIAFILYHEMINLSSLFFTDEFCH